MLDALVRVLFAVVCIYWLVLIVIYFNHHLFVYIVGVCHRLFDQEEYEMMDQSSVRAYWGVNQMIQYVACILRYNGVDSRNFVVRSNGCAHRSDQGKRESAEVPVFR